MTDLSDGIMLKHLARAIKRAKMNFADRVPDTKDALQLMFKCYDRLRDLGWKDAVYCPKDGTVFEVIEAGSTGIHDCVYEGQWPNGRWWILAENDMWPSRLFGSVLVVSVSILSPVGHAPQFPVVLNATACCFPACKVNMGSPDFPMPMPQALSVVLRPVLAPASRIGMACPARTH